jgi:hypothetical protein
MKKQVLHWKYGSTALVALMAVFSLVFCPCTEASAYDQINIQKVSSSQDHDCCNKKKPSCAPDTCSFSSIQTSDYLSPEIKAPNLSKNVVFEYGLVSSPQAFEVVSTSSQSPHRIEGQRFTGPPIYLKNSLLRI